MNKIYIDFRRVRPNNYNGIIVVLLLLFALVALCYILLHDPYREIHNQIFQTAENIRNYYRDRPGYWKLSTDSAINDNLVGQQLLGKEYKLKVGIGISGDMAMPADNTFDLVISDLNKSSCISLTEANVKQKQQLILQKITIISSKGTTEFTWGDKEHPLPVAKYATRNICQPTNNTVMWTFQ